MMPLGKLFNMVKIHVSSILSRFFHRSYNDIEHENTGPPLRYLYESKDIDADTYTEGLIIQGGGAYQTEQCIFWHCPQANRWVCRLLLPLLPSLTFCQVPQPTRLQTICAMTVSQPHPIRYGSSFPLQVLCNRRRTLPYSPDFFQDNIHVRDNAYHLQDAADTLY